MAIAIKNLMRIEARFFNPKLTILLNRILN
jgi:hypothetical protein